MSADREPFPDLSERAAVALADRISVAMIRRADEPADVCRWHRDLVDLVLEAVEFDRLRAEIEALRELYTEENNERAKAQAEIANLRAGISWARGMLSDETPHALVDMFLGALLGGSPLPSDEETR